MLDVLIIKTCYLRGKCSNVPHPNLHTNGQLSDFTLKQNGVNVMYTRYPRAMRHGGNGILNFVDR